MLIGGCAGSTGGAIKVVRHLARSASCSGASSTRPCTARPSLPIRLNGRVVDERTLRAILAFVLLYVGLFLAGALVLAIESARAGLEVTAVRGAGCRGDDARQRRAGVRLRRADRARSTPFSAVRQDRHDCSCGWAGSRSSRSPCC